MKQHRALAAAMVALAAVLSGCSSGEETPEPSSTSSPVQRDLADVAEITKPEGYERFDTDQSDRVSYVDGETRTVLVSTVPPIFTSSQDIVQSYVQGVLRTSQTNITVDGRITVDGVEGDSFSGCASAENMSACMRGAVVTHNDDIVFIVVINSSESGNPDAVPAEELDEFIAGITWVD